MSRSTRALATSLASLALIAGCGVVSGCTGDTGEEVDNFASDQATLLDFAFEGKLIARSVFNVERTIEDQMLYTIGHLNGNKAVGRLDQLKITDIEKEELEDGNTLVTYKATIPVGWGSKTNLPESYELILPLHVDHDDYEKFTEKYSASCVDWSAHDVDTGSMWYYYRPNANRCDLAEEDVFKTTATVTKSELNTTGKYPEYHKVWEDEALTGVFIFGKYEDGATSGDSGITAYNNFLTEMKSKFGEGLTTEPAEVPRNPGIDLPDVTFRASLEDGRKIEITALLVDNVRTAGQTFNDRYEALSGDADIIAYNGHAGLGANVRALASKGKFLTGKYQIFFMNGCDTFAYIDDQLQQAHADVNDDDPVGSRYLDMVTNVMPSYFHAMPRASMALVNGLLDYNDPKTYEAIFKNIDRSEVVVVTGEEDNVYEPGFNPGGNTDWEGFEDKGSVAPGESVRFSLGRLEPGTYIVSMMHDEAAPGGDADLYVATGREPSADDYDHRPYLYGSNESVTVKIEDAAEVHIMVHGYDYEDVEASAFLLTAQPAE